MNEVKIRENKDANGMENAKFYIAYTSKANIKERKERSFEILSAIKGDKDVIIELKSSLLSVDVFKREKCSIDFLKGIKDLGLAFRSRKVPAKDQGSVFTKLLTFGQAPKDAYEIVSYISNETWDNPVFRELVPYFGLSYYVLKENTDALKTMEDLFNGQYFDDEKLDIFESYIFDCVDFGQMGVFSKNLEYSYLESALLGK